MSSKLLFKVIRKNTRSSAMASGKYALSYYKDCIVEALPNTLGIFCFETKEAAEHFRNHDSSLKTITVMPIGRVQHKQKFVALYANDYTLDKYYQKKAVDKFLVQYLTVFCKQVKVID